jgi:AcrR family transcriptional regulator
MPQKRRSTKSTTRHDLVANRILDEAASLFAERGFSETSLQEVADALEISRTALYHYIGSKDELLATMSRGLAQAAAEDLEEIAANRRIDPLEKLRQAALTMTSRIGSSPARFRMLLLSEGSLAEPVASEHRKARLRILQALSAIIEQGIKGRMLRPVEPHVAAFALLGMCNWVAWWYQPDRPDAQTPEAIAETIAEIAIKGLQAPTVDGKENGADPTGKALSRIREDLQLLESALQAQSVQKAATRRSARGHAGRG